MDSIKNVEINSVKIRSGWNCRADQSNESLVPLIESIKAIGLKHPILLNDKMELVAGHRRFSACKIIGMDTVIARIQSYASKDHERLAHIDENLQTKSLNEKEMEKALFERKSLWKKMFPVQRGRPKDGAEKNTTFEKETSEVTGESENMIRRKILRVEGVTDEVRKAYENDDISKSIVDELVKLPLNLQNTALDKIIEKGLSVAETRLLVLDIKEKKKNDILNDAMGKFDEINGNEQNKNAEEKSSDECVKIDIDLVSIENSAYAKRIISKVKDLNNMLVSFIRNESWSGISQQIINDLTIDIGVLDNNVQVIKSAIILD